MPFSTINLGSTDTRLLKHADTVYKVKFSGRDDFFLAEVCTQDQANKELEEVLRGVIYLDQRDGPLKPIHTEHFQVHVKRRSWKIADKICFKQNGRSLKNYHYFYEFAVAARAEEEDDQEYLSDEAQKVDADADKEGEGDSNGDEKGGKNSNVDEESEENSNDIVVEDEINDAGSESRQSWSESLDDSLDDWTPSDSSDVDWWRVSKGYKGKKKKSRLKSSRSRTLQKNKAEDSSDGEESMIQNLQKKKKRKTKVLQISESESESKESSTPDDTIKPTERKGKKSVAKNTKKQKPKKSLDSNRNVDNILGTSYRETRQKRIAEDSMNSSLLGGRRSRRLYNTSDGPMTELPLILEPDICSINVDDNDRGDRSRSIKGDRSRSRSRRDEEESNVSKIEPKYTSLDKLTETTSTRRESLRERKGVATVTSPTESKSKNSEKTEVHSNRKESLGGKSARASVTSPKYSGQDNTNTPSNRRGSQRERRGEISYASTSGPKSESPKDDESTRPKSESPKDDKTDDKRRSLLGRKVDKDKRGGDKETVSSEEECAESHESKTQTRKQKQKIHDSNGTISPSGGTKSSTGRKKSPNRGSDLEQLSYSEGRRIRYTLRSPVKRLQKDARQLRSQSSSPVKRAVGGRSSLRSRSNSATLRSPVKRLQKDTRQLRSQSSSPVKRAVGGRSSLRSRSNSATNQLGRKSYLADESGRLQRMRLSAEKDNSRKVALTPRDRHVVEKEELGEVLKLQELAKSEPTRMEQRKTAKKRNSTGMWDMIDSVMNPVVKLFRGSRNSDT